MFADRLRLLRKEHNLTQVQFAQNLNVANGTVAMWETGKREPDFDTILRIADFFHVSIDYLLGRDKEKPAPTSEGELDKTAKHFADLVDKLTPDQQQLLLAQLQAWTGQNQRQESVVRQSDSEKAPGSGL